MPHDIVVKGGTIVDGTGGASYAADLAIDGGRISAIGAEVGVGRRVIDAGGMTVSPGFVDLHTHLDAQVCWDSELTPVSWHGVTTALLGNCGVGFAPCKPEDRELLAGMMETVEGIPQEAIMSGLPWSWEDYGGYLDAIEVRKPGINIAGLVGHCALRFYVMGERAVEEQATPEERQRMAEIVGQSIDRGAAGFSTGRCTPHRMPDGRSVPGTFADPIELVEIGREIAKRDGLMQIAPREVVLHQDREALVAEFEVLGRVADESKSRIITVVGASEDMRTATDRRELVEHLCQGRDLTALTNIRAVNGLFGLQANLPAKGGETWEKLRRSSFAERLAAINDAEVRARLGEEARHEGATQIDMRSVFYLGDGVSPNYASPLEDSLAAAAAARGEHWSEVFLRLSRETEGLALFEVRTANRNLTAVGDLLRSECCLPSLGDAGAHVADMMDSSWATFVLSHWVRSTGVYSLPEAIRRMTSASARLIGLKDRGTLAVGMRADVNVFDADAVAELQPRLVHDFPGGAPRYIQHSTGYRATIVNGQINVLDGEHAGARAGQVLRHAH